MGQISLPAHHRKFGTAATKPEIPKSRLYYVNSIVYTSFVSWIAAAGHAFSVAADSHAWQSTPHCVVQHFECSMVVCAKAEVLTDSVLKCLSSLYMVAMVLLGLLTSPRHLTELNF